MDPLVDVTYATALYEAAADAGLVNDVRDELTALSGVFGENPSLKKLFLVPTIAATDKKTVAGRIFDGKISTLMMNFIYILIDKRRIGAWDGIVNTYQKILDEKDGLTKGIIYSVVPLDAEQLLAFESETAKVLLKRVKLENRTDETLIGGVRIYIEGKLIDISIRHRLELLKAAMLGKQ